MKEVLLPNYFKKIGVATGMLSLIFYIAFGTNHEMIPLVYDPEIISWIAKDIAVVALLFIAFSKEKKQIKDLNTLRFERLKQSMIFGAVILIFDSISEMIFNREEIEVKNAYEIVIMVLLFYIVTFHFEKSKTSAK